MGTANEQLSRKARRRRATRRRRTARTLGTALVITSAIMLAIGTATAEPSDGGPESAKGTPPAYGYHSEAPPGQKAPPGLSTSPAQPDPPGQVVRSENLSRDDEGGVIPAPDAADLSTAAAGDPPGNNGTVKVHDIDISDDDHRTTPKVCEFRIVGFGFDSGQSLTLSIEGAPTPNGGTGSYATTVVAGTDGGFAQPVPTLPDGDYRVTLYTGVNGGEKHKNLEVDCVTPAEGVASGGTQTDVAGVAVTRDAVNTVDPVSGQLAATGVTLRELLLFGGAALGLGLILWGQWSARRPHRVLHA